MNLNRDELEENGYLLARQLFAKDEALALRKEIIRLHGHLADTQGSLDLWEGVTTHSGLWPTVLHPPLLRAVRGILGDEARYARNSEVHANHAGFLWHRDCIDQSFGVGPDWEDEIEPYRLLRVCIYLQTYEESGFRLGVMPGSHRHETSSLLGVLRRNTYRALRKWTGSGSWDYRRRENPIFYMGKHPSAQFVAAKPKWIEVGLGDCVLLHQRLLHSSSPIRGPQFAIYFSFGLDDRHTARQWHHYRRERSDRSQRPLVHELVERLDAADVLLQQDRDEATGLHG